jgi:hypothetical protein
MICKTILIPTVLPVIITHYKISEVTCRKTRNFEAYLFELVVIFLFLNETAFFMSIKKL